MKYEIDPLFLFMSTSPFCSLTVSFAAQLPVALILRRGPTNEVCAIKWDLNRDEFEVGQWFKGRILNATLSPNGKWLAAFCAKRGETWTSLSRTPYLTAHVYWQKRDHWPGGAYFRSDEHLLLRHSAEELDANGVSGRLPSEFRIGLANFRGDFLTFEMQARRWEFLPAVSLPEPRTNWWLPTPWADPPQPWIQKAQLGHSLVQWSATKTTIQSADGTTIADVSSLYWKSLDFHGQGDLLFSQGGKLFRAPAEHFVGGYRDVEALVGASHQLADFSSMLFEEKVAPPWAMP